MEFNRLRNNESIARTVNSPTITLGFWTLLCVALCCVSATSLAMSDKKEKEIGKEMYDGILAEMPIYDEPKLVEYVNNVGNRIAKISNRPDYDFTFTIIDSPDINAFATPGGYVYINRGLITYMTSEAQLAAVLAHEIAHVTEDHPARIERASTTNQVLSQIIGFITQSGDVAEASALWGQSMVSGYGRDMELEADQVGAQYLFKAGYPPAAMIEVISILKDTERVEKRKARDTGKEARSYHGLFATHPRNDQRLQQVIAEAGELPQSLDAEKNIVPFRVATDGLTWGDSVRPPKPKKNRFYQEQLRFRFDYPEGWEFTQKSNAIAGRAAEKPYQMTIEIHQRTKDSPYDFLKNQLGYSLIKKSEAFTQARLNGHRGFVDSADGKPDQRIAVIYYSRYAYVFRGELLEGDDLKAADEEFNYIINSFRPLSVRQQQARDAKAIEYVKAKQGLTFEKLAKYLKLGKYGEDELRLINGYYPVGEPDPGEWIKIIR